jgi:carbon monoxide dehydrogenase subunit G
MKIEDSFIVQAPRDRVWAAIIDPARIAPCIPGCESIEISGPNCYRARVSIAVGPIKAAFNLEVEVTEETPPSFLASTTRGEEGTRASVLTAHNELHLKTLEDGSTEVRYVSDVSIVGRLGRFGLGVMKKKAAALGVEFAEAFRARVERGEAA